MVLRGETDDGRWMVFERRPHPLLAPYVRGCFQGYDIAMKAPTTRLEVPHGGIVLIIGIGPSIQVDDTAQRSFVAGLHQRPVLVGDDGCQTGVQVNLTPLGARMLFGLPMRELADLTIPLDALLPTDLPERLAELPGWPARFDALESLLLGRLTDAPPPRPDVEFAWRRLETTSGQISIADLCVDIGCSRRHLATRFGEEVGVTPKQFARIVRFERAAHLLSDGLTPAAAAAASGYADQPHMTRDFRAFAGCGPASYAAAVTKLQDGVGIAA